MHTSPLTGNNSYSSNILRMIHPGKVEKQIFEKGFENLPRTFLARRILALTGISIRETGIEGKGAKFDILVPSEFYRIKPEKWGTTIWSDQREA